MRTDSDTGDATGGATGARRPGHHATRPSNAVTAGTSSTDTTTDTRTMPSVTANPISVKNGTRVSSSEPNVPARIAAAATTDGPACSTASAAARRGPLPSAISSRSRAVMRML